MNGAVKARKPTGGLHKDKPGLLGRSSDVAEGCNKARDEEVATIRGEVILGGTDCASTTFVIAFAGAGWVVFKCVSVVNSGIGKSKLNTAWGRAKSERALGFIYGCSDFRNNLIEKS